MGEGCKHGYGNMHICPKCYSENREDNMTDDQVRAELERIDGQEQTLPWLFETIRMARKPSAITLATLKALRLLAESQQALRKIATGDVRNGWEMVEIAHNAIGGK